MTRRSLLMTVLLWVAILLWVWAPPTTQAFAQDAGGTSIGTAGVAAGAQVPGGTTGSQATTTPDVNNAAAVSGGSAFYYEWRFVETCGGPGGEVSASRIVGPEDFYALELVNGATGERTLVRYGCNPDRTPASEPPRPPPRRYRRPRPGT